MKHTLSTQTVHHFDVIFEDPETIEWKGSSYFGRQVVVDGMSWKTSGNGNSPISVLVHGYVINKNGLPMSKGNTQHRVNRWEGRWLTRDLAWLGEYLRLAEKITQERNT